MLMLAVCVCALWLQPAAKAEAVRMQKDVGTLHRPEQEETQGDEAALEQLIALYEEYEARFAAIEKVSDIEENGFFVIEEQSFPVILESFGEEEVIFWRKSTAEWGY